MKTELLVILALAAALAFHRHDEASACGPSGCLLLPPDFQQSVTAVPTDPPVVIATGN
jgi:hypothetical protein